MMFARFISAFVASVVGIALLVPLMLILLPFWCVSFVLKIAKKLRPEVLDWKNTNNFDRILGWRPKPNINARVETDGIYRLTTGQDGWRGNYSLKDSDVVVIGDSFVFGKGADDKDHFANLTQRAQVKPMGAPGYGTTHYLLILKTLTSELKGKLVLWFVYTGNDYRESLRPSSYGKPAPFVFYDHKKREWEIKTDHIFDKKLPFHFEKGYKVSMHELADLFSKNYLSDYTYRAFEYLITEAKKHCEANDAAFAVATLPIKWLIDGSYVHKIKRYSGNPEKFSGGYPDEQAARICERHGITFRECLNEFSREDFLPNDLHWSRSGNEKAAKIIDELHASFSEKKTK